MKSSSKEEIDRGLLEAIFFSSPRPLTKERISKILGVDKKEVDSIMEKFMDEFNRVHKGVKIVKKRKYYYLSIDDKYIEYVSTLMDPPPLNNRQRLVIAYLYKNKESMLKELRNIFGPYIYRDLKKLRRWGFVSIITRDKRKYVVLRPEAEAYIIRRRGRR